MMAHQEHTYFRYWGKANKPEDGEGPAYHLLPFHCLDVAAVGTIWWESSPSLRVAVIECSNCSEPQAKAWVLFFLALHDYGKLDIRFQLKCKETLISAWEGYDDSLVNIRGIDIKDYFHGPAGFSWFYRDFQPALGWSEYDTDVWEAWSPWLAAVTGHHGVIPCECESRHYLGKRQADISIQEQDHNARIEWVQGLEKLFLSPAGLSIRDLPPPCSSLLAGFCSVCDWLGSDSAAGKFEYVAEACEEEDLSAYFQRAQEIAGKMLAESGLLASKRDYRGVGVLLPEDEHGDKPKPRQLQTLVDELPLARGLTLIEAPTGSGKTETSLAYAWRLLETGLADSIVFALPTQATANAMLERVEKIAPLLFEEHPNLVLAHGKARFNEDFWRLKQAAENRTAQGTEEARAECAGWLSASRKRAFLGQIGVCTVDQVLVSVLPIKHNFVRGFGLGKSVLIVDEVHAYDFYMYGLLDEVIKGQHASGGGAVLLSATLPSEQRRLLLSAWGANAEIRPDAPYPLISHCHGDGEIAHFELPGTEQPPAKSRWVLAPGAADWKSAS